MTTIEVYKRSINMVLCLKGYPDIEWTEIEGNTMQDEAFIQAAIVVMDELKASL